MNEAIKPTLKAYERYALICVGDRCAGEGGGQALYDELKIKLKLIAGDDDAVSSSNVAERPASVFARRGPLLCV